MPRKSAKGTIKVTADNGRRLITLDPIHAKELAIPAREVESTIPCGFRQEWAKGERDGKEFFLAAGAGCGSEWLTLTYGNRDFCINVRDIAEALFAFADETAKA